VGLISSGAMPTIYAAESVAWIAWQRAMGDCVPGEDQGPLTHLTKDRSRLDSSDLSGRSRRSGGGLGSTKSRAASDEAEQQWRWCLIVPRPPT
jgi:hypothetical protein